ncbi:hypothetical protein [Methanimicrococcus hongohii]|nr:hypothetical protein [Methanimicrococcus sp. Hf6]
MLRASALFYRNPNAIANVLLLPAGLCLPLLPTGFRSAAAARRRANRTNF